MKTSTIISIAKTGMKHFFDIDPNVTEHVLSLSGSQAVILKGELKYAAHIKAQTFTQALSNWMTALRPQPMHTPEYSA